MVYNISKNSINFSSRWKVCVFIYNTTRCKNWTILLFIRSCHYTSQKWSIYLCRSDGVIWVCFSITHELVKIKNIYFKFFQCMCNVLTINSNWQKWPSMSWHLFACFNAWLWFISIVLDANQSSRAQQKKEEKKKEAKRICEHKCKVLITSFPSTKYELIKYTQRTKRHKFCSCNCPYPVVCVCPVRDFHKPPC